jgi:hypothetical protein
MSASAIGFFSSLLKPAFGSIRLDKLTPSQIQKAYNSWTRQDGKPLSPRTRRYMHVILKSSLARAVEQQSLARNPADIFSKRLPKIERRELTILTVEQSAPIS